MKLVKIDKVALMSAAFWAVVFIVCLLLIKHFS